MLEAPPLPASYTPPEVARHLRVKAERVIGWIRAGRLQAIDVSAPGTRRPRFRILPEALKQFEQSLSVTAPTKPLRCHQAKKRRYFA